jgi:hypothetical protein
LVHWKSAFRDPRCVATAVIAAGGLAIYLINYPGSMEFDSFVQLVEARSQQYSNWHPAIISWMLGVFDALPGPVAAWFVGLDMVLVFGALAAVVWLPRRVSWVAVAFAAGMLFLPQFVLTQAVVWKDAQFADAVLAAFVCLAFLDRCGWRGRAVLIAAAVALLTLAALIRENGIVIVPVAAAALAVILRRCGVSRRSAWLSGGALLIAVAGLAVATNAVLQLRADTYDGRQEKIKVFQYYDIVGMVHRDPAVGVAVLEREAPATAHLLHTQSVKRWSPVKNDTLLTEEMAAALEATPASVMRRQWLQAIKAHPGDYLATRALLFRWVFEAPDVWKCHPFHVGDEGDPDDFKELDMQPRMNARDEMLKNYGYTFKPGPAYSHGLYALIALGAMILLLRRREPADVALSALIGSAFLFAATFLIISIACDYRYLYLVDLSALAGALYVTADWRALFRR